LPILSHPYHPIHPHGSFLAALAQRSPKHADALEMTKLFHSVNFAQTLGVNQAVSL
jgi:hypothetical protein